MVLGIDPGTARTGYGLVERQGDQVRFLEYGCITTSKNDSRAERLRQIHEELRGLMDRVAVHEIVVEKLFFNRNVNTAMAVGEARGVVLLTAAQYAIPVFEFNPNQVKQALTGYGQASKDQVRQMVMMQLGLEEPPRPDDASDALAIALTHIYYEDLGL
ncbi:MAG: crossover junction endodeoxyribonuclease RuvC [Armatimonadetes bacterium]|nr:crossover junction endodeoxyribonuclease RuvC [Armatimonadota bacterium]